MPRIIAVTTVWMRRTFALGTVLAAATPAWAQCAMCRATASYQREQALASLNLGIILLAVPPAAIAGGIAWLTYRYRSHSTASAPNDQR